MELRKPATSDVGSMLTSLLDDSGVEMTSLKSS